MIFRYRLILFLLFLINCDNRTTELGVPTPEGMVWIAGGTFMQGALDDDEMALDHEFPRHEVNVAGFFMDITEVTNQQFAKFVYATGYITVAERIVDWEVLKKQVPLGTPKPPDSLLQPGSLTFHKPSSYVSDLRDFSQWWKWTLGANWRNPQGPGSSIEGKGNHPVVQIAYEDAIEYCRWAGRRLPTESEWEFAARANRRSQYVWGDDKSLLTKNANTWSGNFPNLNNQIDGFEYSAQVKSYPPNDFGLYDMAGNVWEWTSDDYMPNYLDKLKDRSHKKRLGSMMHQANPDFTQKVIKGGSFLCHEDYCASYRIPARMNSDPNSPAEHIGFRTVATVKMIQKSTSSNINKGFFYPE